MSYRCEELAETATPGAWQVLTPMGKASIGAVLGWGCLAEVFPTIVGRVAILMVDGFFRPTAGHNEPSKPMDRDILALKENVEIFPVFAASRITGLCPVPLVRRFPGHKAGFWAIGILVPDIGYNFVNDAHQNASLE